MITKITKSTITVALLAVLGTASIAQAQERVYVIDQRGAVATSGTGLCWRTGYWTPAAAANDPAGCQCDKDLLPASVCSPPVATPQPRPAPPKPPVNNRITLDADTLFDFNKDVLRPEGKATLDELARRVEELRTIEVITAVGHTDRIGGEAYNQRLSERRAAAVKQYLISRGIADNLIYTEGRGETQPVTGSDCDGFGNARSQKLIACLQPDRRVDIEVIGTEK